MKLFHELSWSKGLNPASELRGAQLGSFCPKMTGHTLIYWSLFSEMGWLFGEFLNITRHPKIWKYKQVEWQRIFFPSVCQVQPLHGCDVSAKAVHNSLLVGKLRQGLCPAREGAVGPMLKFSYLWAFHTLSCILTPQILIYAAFGAMRGGSPHSLHTQTRWGVISIRV